MTWRGFILYGCYFWLNDNRKDINIANYIFYPKYKLLVWMPQERVWLETGYCCDTKKDAIAWAKANKLYMKKYSQDNQENANE